MKTKQTTIKKIKIIVCSAAVAGLLAGCGTEKGEAKSHNQEAKQAKLMAEAKITKDAAEQTALTQAPNGALKEAEIEKEKGRLIWSFEFTTPDSPKITEVNVDAITGAIVNVEQETPKAEEKETNGGKDKDND